MGKTQTSVAELRILFYSISVFTSIIVMSDIGTPPATTPQRATPGCYFVVPALVIICFYTISISWILLPSSSNSLFGTDNYELNRYYSAKTTHVHKFNLLRTSDHLRTPDPSHWEALGVIIPAVDEQYHVQKFDIGKDFVTAEESNCTGGKRDSVCLLERNYGDYVFLNGESMSIVSQISPSIYFATLTTIYLLSFITIGSKSLAYVISFIQPKFSTEEWIRKALYTIIFIVYINGVITAYGSSPFLNAIKTFDDNDTHYTISSHMPSIIACTITLFIYLIHLRSRNITWFTDDEFWEVEDKTTEVPNATKSNMELRYTKVPGNESQSYKGSSTTVDASTGGTFTTGEDGSISKFLQTMQKYIPSPSTGKIYVAPIDAGHEFHGPTSSESSVIGALTVFLGGMGSLGLARGIIPEVEAQLVLGCTLGFALLEVCSNRLRAYYNFMFGQTQKLGNDADIQLAYFRGTHLIRFVILCLQLYLLVIYNNTIAHLDLKNYQHAFFIFFCCFWAVQLLLFVMDILGFDHNQQKTVADIRWKADYGICIIAFIVILSIIAEYTRLGGTIADDLLLKYEEKQYSLDTPTKNPACTAQTISLVSSLLKNDGINPVDLKVYFWTRGWNLDLSVSPSFAGWFCTNGLEHHWGQCQYSPANQDIPETVRGKIATSRSPIIEEKYRVIR